MDKQKDTVGWPRTTTHLQNWLFASEAKFRERQELTFHSAVERLKAKGIEEAPVTLEEELWLVKYYSFQLSGFLSSNHMKETVKETALVFFNRFYLMRSMLEHDPRLVMFTCVTLAIKLEDMWRNYFVDKLLGSVEGLDITRVFAMEAVVCDALNFNFLYLKESLGIDDDILGEHLGLILSVCNEAQKDAVMMNVIPEFTFLYTPTQLAVANFARHSKSKLGELMSVPYEEIALWARIASRRTNLSRKNNKQLLSSMDSQEQKAGTIMDRYLSLYNID
ncbi:cyclin ccnh rpt1 domain containing protein [Babesia gibsoni]|uniref:Cyclin ccnh rpt1 domain containing protein n=1 Tax=Babesia gibsoni TaxID=33632 RepID=A0AAD8UT67_BABGI|nr:cyclin ccnh rpt1 domain containing protein [Babesia gibsoni]